MPAISTLSSLAVLALSSVSQARPIPHTVSLFRRAILNANDGYLVIQNEDAPKTYSPSKLEPYDHYHFRYMAIGCTDVDKKAEFFDTCCQPRPINRQADWRYPAACNLESYLVFDPDYKKDETVAKLGSLKDYQAKSGYDDSTDVSGSYKSSGDGKDSDKKEDVVESSSSSSKKESSSSSSSSKTWTPSSSSSKWTPSSSSEWTPEATSTWTPESSSKQWTPEAEPSSSSSEKVWEESSAKAAAVWTPSSETWTSSTPAAPAPAPTSSSNSGGGGSSGDFTGTGSWYTQNGNAGACGVYHSDSDYIVALAADFYGPLGQQSQYCGRSLTITNTDNGNTAQAIVADACPGCSSYHSLDLSTGLFQALGNLDTGLIPISWHFN